MSTLLQRNTCRFPLQIGCLHKIINISIARNKMLTPQRLWFAALSGLPTSLNNDDMRSYNSVIIADILESWKDFILSVPRTFQDWSGWQKTLQINKHICPNQSSFVISARKSFISGCFQNYSVHNHSHPATVVKFRKKFI